MIYKLRPKALSNLIDKWSNLEDISNSLFYTKKGDIFIGVDNEGSDCYVEEFDSLDKTLLWLVNKDLMVEDVINMQDIEVRKSLSRFKYEILNDFVLEI